MSQRQVEAMAAGTILAGGGTPLMQPQNTGGSTTVFPIPETPIGRMQREANEECERRAREILAEICATSDDLMNRSDPPDSSSIVSGWDNGGSRSSGYDGSSGGDFSF